MNNRNSKLSRLILLAGLVLAASVGESRVPSEYELKAAFLCKFGRYVEWPASSFASADSPVVIGVMGRDPFGPFLDATVRLARVRGRKVELRRFKTASEAKLCHLLFISSSEERRLTAILEALAGAAVLTVGESEWFARDGGMIRFDAFDESVQLEINLLSAQRAGLNISSRLLKLARITSGEGPK